MIIHSLTHTTILPHLLMPLFDILSHPPTPSKYFPESSSQLFLQVFVHFLSLTNVSSSKEFEVLLVPLWVSLVLWLTYSFILSSFYTFIPIYFSNSTSFILILFHFLHSPISQANIHLILILIFLYPHNSALTCNHIYTFKSFYQFLWYFLTITNSCNINCRHQPIHLPFEVFSCIPFKLIHLSCPYSL